MRADGSSFPGLPAAIAAVRNAHPDRLDLQALAWTLLPRLPGKPRTSANLKEEGASSQLNPLEDVILSDPWLGMNSECAVNVLWAETDKPGLAERLALMREAGLPVAWTACGQRGGHVAFIIKEPVVTGLPGQKEADRRRLRKLSLVHSFLNTAIDGDRSAGLRGMTKNPFSTRWDVEVGDLTPRTLDEILQPLQAMAKVGGWEAPRQRYWGDRKREPSPEGRNCALFDLTRWWAGDDNVRDGAAILDKAAEFNAGFAVPLGHGEVACVARSITRFMQTRYDGRGCRKSKYKQAVKECQAAAGRTTAATRAASRSAELAEAAARIRERGGALGQADLAAEAGVSVRTVQRAWATLWAGFVNTTPLAPPLSGSSADCPPSAEPDSAHTAPSELSLPTLQGPEGDRRFMPRRARAALARYEREAWHRKAALAGSGAYRLDWHARQWRLWQERRAELWPFRETCARLGERLMDGSVDVPAAIAANERLRRVTLAWASRLAAEDRCRERTLESMPPEPGSVRFRTTPDGIDLLAQRVDGLSKVFEDGKVQRDAV